MTVLGFWIMMIIIWVAMGVGCWFMIWLMLLRYKHKFRVKELTGGKYIVHDFRFREMVDREGQTWWAFQRKNKYCPYQGLRILPETVPEEAIEINDKGRKIVTATWTPTKSFQFQKTPLIHFMRETFKKPNKVDKDKPDTEHGEFNYVKSFHDPTKSNEVLTKDALSSYLRHERKAESRRKKDKLEYYSKMVQVGATAAIIVIALVFVPDILSKWGEIIDASAAVMKQAHADRIEWANKLDEVLNNKRWVDTSVTLNQAGQYINATPPG